MKVLIFSAYDPIPSDGVTVIRYARLAEELLKQGHQVLYITSSFFHLKHKQRTNKQWSENGNPIGLELRFLNSPSYNKNTSLKRLYNHWQLGRELKKLLHDIEKPDLVLAASPPLKACNVLLKWAKKNEIYSVLDIQDAWPEALEQFAPRPFSKLLLAPLYKTTKENQSIADAITSVSQDYMKDIAGKTSAVFPLGAFNFSKTIAEDGSIFKLAYLGNAASNYALVQAIDAIAGMNEVELHVFGLGDNSNIYRTHIEGNGYRNIFFKKTDTTIELPELLSQCHAGLMLLNPKSFIASPNKMFAYFAAGLPIISNIRGGETENLINTNQLGITLSADGTPALREAVYFCKEHFNKDDRRRIQTFAAKHLHSNDIYKSYANWLGQLLKKKK